MLAQSPRSSLIIDTRPLWRVVLARTHHWIVMALAAGVFSWLMLGTTPEGLTPEGQRALAVFSVCVIFWVTQAIPLSVTGLLALALLPICRVVPAQDTFALFGSQAVFFILGAFILAAAVMHTGLSTRVAMWVLRRFGTTPRRLMIGLLLLSAAMAHLMPEHAVAAMLLPIVVEITRSLRLVPGRSRLGSGLVLAMAWGAIIGGVATFLGGARNPLAIEILHATTGQTIGFLEWWITALPLVVLSLAGTAIMLLLLFKPEVDSVEPAHEVLRQRLQLMGRPTLEELITALVMVLTIGGWVLAEPLGWNIAVVALGGASALFALRVIPWSAVEEHVNWGVILMYGGAIALGQAMSVSGAAAWIAQSTISDSMLGHPLLVLGILAAVSLVLTEGMSNSAIVALMLPLALDLGPLLGESGVDPRLIVFAIALPAGLAFTLPISSPPNALAHSTGHVTMRTVMLKGPLINVMCLIIFLLVLVLYFGPIMGLH